MNHRNTTLAVAAIFAAAALTGVAFAIPQQVMAGGHRHGHNHNNGGSVKVDQQVNQLNECNGSSSSPRENTAALTGGSDLSGTVCANIGANSAEINR